MSTTCKHCQVTFEPSQHATLFCCKGCEYVYQLIHDQGFKQFYQLREGTSLPVKSVPYQTRDYSWLTSLGEKAEAQAGNTTPELILDLQGVSCIGCAWLIEKIFAPLPGAISIHVNAQSGQLRLRWVPQQFDLLHFAETLQQYGYLVGPIDGSPKPTHHALTLKIGLCAAFALNAMLFTLPQYLGMEASFSLARLFDLLTVLFATLSLLIGGSYFFNRAWQGIQQRILHIDLPISLGILVAYLSSFFGWILHLPTWVYFDFVTVFIFLMLIGRWTQEYAIGKNRNQLLKSKPLSSVTKVISGQPQKSPIESLVTDETIEVAPGQTIPVCARLLGTSAQISLEWINGEAEPHTYASVADIPSGAINIGSQSLRLQAKESWQDSLLARLMQETSENLRNPLLEKTLRWYIGSVLFIALGGFAGWGLMAGAWALGTQAMVSILVISCPCALGVAFPLINEIAVSRLQSAGLFVRKETLWARLPKVKKIIFDKTGTLTLESPQLINPSQLQSLSPSALHALQVLTENNWHPISRSLRESLPASHTSSTHTANQNAQVHEAIGSGLWAQMGETTWSLGKPSWNPESPLAPKSDSEAYDCVLKSNGEPIAAFSFQESLKEDAHAEITQLQKAGFTIHILSGDRTAKVTALARQLDIPQSNLQSELTPDEKAHWIRTHSPQDGLMIGDGANDSLAFNQALCCGTPVVDRNLLERKADFYFLGRGLTAIGKLFQIAQKRKQAIWLVFAFAVSYNLFAISLCLVGKMNPLLAAILMPLSSLATIGLGLWKMR